MTRRTRFPAQHSDLPLASVDLVQEQGGQQDLNNLHAEEVPKHRPRKELMAINVDDNANLEELTRCTERLEDVIGAVQTMVNQLNQSLVLGQGIQLLPTLVGPTQQAPSPYLGGSRETQEQANESQIELAGCQPHQRRKSHSPPRHRGDVR